MASLCSQVRAFRSRSMPDLSSAELSKLRGNIEELLQCPVCFEPCNPPKILKYCGHYFCLTCLTAIYAKAEQRGSMRCPLCNYKSKLVISGVFGQKKTPKPEHLRKLLPDCRTLRILASHSASTLIAQAAVISRLLVCRLCRERTVNHRMLPFCQHSFCLQCLVTLYASSSRGSLVCPTCESRIVFVSAKKATPPPPSSVIGSLLPVDYALSTLLDAV